MPHQETTTVTQKAAEAGIEEFQKKLGPFVVAAETTRMPMVFTDAKQHDNPIIFANASFLALTNYSKEEILGQSFNFLMAREADAEALGQIQSTFESNSGGDPEICFRRNDGSLFWASVFISPVRDNYGEIIQYFASFQDLTKHRQENKRLRTLLAELNHRTQNTLATVLAIARQTLRGMADEETINVFEGRILALSKTQSLLGLKNWEEVGLRDLLKQILQPFGLNDDRDAQFSIKGGEVALQSKAALTLAVVFNELATNALKHGALSNRTTGQIEVSWETKMSAQDNRMWLRWRESGGPRVTPPGRKGFGSRLIERGLAQELNGDVRLAYEPTGVTCDIVMPLGRADKP